MKISNKIKKVKLSDIKPYKNNPKKHTEKQIELLKNSIKKNDYLQPIIIDKKNIIIAGHGRYEAMKQINPEAEIEVIDGSHLTASQVRKFRILDNKVNESEWDTDKLDNEIRDIYNNKYFENAVDEIGIDQEYINQVMNDIFPEIENREKEVNFIATENKCPKCGYEW